MLQFTIYRVPASKILPETDTTKPKKSMLIGLCQSEFKEADKETLHKLITAIGKHPENDCAIVHLTDREQISLMEWIDVHQPEAVLLFGGQAENYLLHINPPNPLVPFSWGSTKVLLTHSIEALNQKTALKGPLWNTLKNWFLN